MLEGALILAAGILAGTLLGTRKKARDPQPVCGCTHHHAFHDPATGQCHGTVNGKPTHRDTYGFADAWEQVRCPCRRYTGPEPLPSFYAPEIAETPGD